MPKVHVPSWLDHILNLVLPQLLFVCRYVLNAVINKWEELKAKQIQSVSVSLFYQMMKIVRNEHARQTHAFDFWQIANIALHIMGIYFTLFFSTIWFFCPVLLFFLYVLCNKCACKRTEIKFKLFLYLLRLLFFLCKIKLNVTSLPFRWFDSLTK